MRFTPDPARSVLAALAIVLASRAGAATLDAARDSTASFRAALAAAAFERRLAEAPLVRLHLTTRVLEVSQARANAVGVEFGSNPSRYSLLEDRRELVTWPEIQRIETGRSMAGSLAGLGAMAGIVYGVHWNRQRGDEEGGFAAVFFPAAIFTRAFLTTAAFTLCGAAVGGAVGASIRRWSVVYESPAHAPPHPPAGADSVRSASGGDPPADSTRRAS